VAHVQVLCAKVDVAEGAELEQEMIAVREIPPVRHGVLHPGDADGTPQGESRWTARAGAAQGGRSHPRSMLSTLGDGDGG